MSMEATERLVRTWIATGRDEEVSQIISDIESGRSALLNLVKALGEYLTSEEDVLRQKGVDLLSQVLEKCSPAKINKQATRVLVTFYTGKLEDPETVIPSLKGLVPLTALPTFSGAEAVDTIKALFSHVKMKGLNQSSRYLVFKILDSLVARHRDALKGMGKEFITGYTSFIDGEKDPRNLLLAFSMDRVICIEFDISEHIEEMFNIIFCYFPITFRPPADDPYGITPEELRAALRSCLNSSPLFSQLAIPLFLDKLLAGSPATKKDIVETIGVCLPVYGPVVARNFAKKLWNFIKLEVFQPVNPEIEAEALKTTQVLIRTIYGSKETSEETSETLSGLAKEICEECLELMKEPEKSQAIPASKVMASLIGTTANVTKLAINQTITHLLGLYRDPDELIHRPQILTLLCIIVSAIDAERVTLEQFGLQGLLLLYKDDVLGAFISGTKNPGSCEAALEGLKKLTKMQDALSEEELVYVVHNINEVLQAEDGEIESASDDALGVLIGIAENHSKIVEEGTLPFLFSSLPESPAFRDAHKSRTKIWTTLRWLAQLCVPAPLFETLVVRLTTKLELIFAPNNIPDDENDYEPRLAYAHGILRTLYSVLELKVNASHADVPKYIDRLVPRIYGLFISQALRGPQYVLAEFYTRLLDISGHIITLVVRTASLERQEKFISELELLYFESNLSLFSSLIKDLPSEVVFKPFEASSSLALKNTISLFSSTNLALRPKVLLKSFEPNEFLDKIQTWGLDNAVNEHQRKAAIYIVATLLNKNRELLSPFITKQLEVVWKEIISVPGLPIEQRQFAIQSWLWITKALVLLNDPAVFTFVDHLFEIFSDPSVGWDAAKVVGHIASGGEDILTKTNHSVIKILYAQKYFRTVLPKIMANLSGVIQSPAQKASLVALTSLISSLPKTVYMSEMSTLMPHLIRGLDLPSCEIRSNIIDTLTVVASSDGIHGPTQEHATTLVSIVLKNALPQEITSVPLRIASLKYLATLPKAVRYDVLHPNKNLVIRELERALDDPKRAVRKEAVNARTAWFLYKG